MRRLTAIENELVEHLVACWRNPGDALPFKFFVALRSIDLSLQTLATTEVSQLRQAPGYRDRFSSEEVYRRNLELRVAQQSGLGERHVRHPAVTKHAVPPGTRSPAIVRSNDIAFPTAVTSQRSDNVSDSSLVALCESIAGTVVDYRADELDRMTPEHVERWVNQFDEADQLTILQEMNRILAACYISRSRAEQITRAMLANTDIFGSYPAATIATSKFLNIQQRGNSQRDLLALTESIMLADYGLRLPSPARPSQFIYLDDCLFTGARVFHDIEGWVSEAPVGTAVWLVFWAGHTSGRTYLYSEKRLGGLPQTAHMNIQARFMARTFVNDQYGTETYDCLWPQAVEADDHVRAYVDAVEERASAKGWSSRLFRPSVGMPKRETLFSSPEARVIVERAFLSAGARIVAPYMTTSGKEHWRPMGFEVLESLGFGAMFVTYRNIANNCPLVLWWGLGGWIPLFERKTNVMGEADGLRSGGGARFVEEHDPDDDLPF